MAEQEQMQNGNTDDEGSPRMSSLANDIRRMLRESVTPSTSTSESSSGATSGTSSGNSSGTGPGETSAGPSRRASAGPSIRASAGPSRRASAGTSRRASAGTSRRESAGPSRRASVRLSTRSAVRYYSPETYDDVDQIESATEDVDIDGDPSESETEDVDTERDPFESEPADSGQNQHESKTSENQDIPESDIEFDGSLVAMAGNMTYNNMIQKLRQKLILLLHAHKCLKRDVSSPLALPCTFAKCPEAKGEVRHMMKCKAGENCTCHRPKALLTHWTKCKNPICALCMPLNDLAETQTETETESTITSPSVIMSVASEQTYTEEAAMESVDDFDPFTAQLFSPEYREPLQDVPNYVLNVEPPSTDTQQRQWSRSSSEDKEN